MNIIGIDPSLISTSITINGDIFNFTEEYRVYNKSGMKKWYKIMEEYTKYIYIDTKKNIGDYNSTELQKLVNYNNITDMIIETIKNELVENIDIIIGIESYSYNSSNGDIIDLVTFSTLLRDKLFSQISENMRIIPPKSLKLLSAKLTYKPIELGKRKIKLKYQNLEGVSGGNFTKKEIYKALIENDDLINNYPYVKFLSEIKDDAISLSSIPKPIDDNNDSYMIYQLLKNNLI